MIVFVLLCVFVVIIFEPQRHRETLGIRHSLVSVFLCVFVVKIIKTLVGLTWWRLNRK